jgi:signal transduction histidine kinase
MSIESPEGAAAAEVTAKALRDAAWGGAQSVASVVENVRKATWSRVSFTALFAALSLPLLSWQLPLVWLAVMTFWELFLRVLLENRLALPAAAHSQQRGFGWLAAINFAGGAAYTLFPVLVWSTGAPVGMVLATAWFCGSANHLFVYFSANRWLLLSCMLPLCGLALWTPFLTGGLSVGSAVMVATLAALMLSAGMFGFDRQVLLSNLAQHAAARAAAEQANAAKSQFLATMSRELRTPLNSVIGYAELIEEETDGTLRDDASKIRGSARQLLSVIDVILDLSKLETGQIELRHERGLVSAILEQLREGALPLATINNNRVVFEELGSLGEADIDHMRLYQCLMQLISNAAKFTRDGEIRIRATRERDQLRFSVSDTGAGIAAADQARIFEPFVQSDTDSVRRPDGTGLGLTLVRRLARLMGGDVSCESAPGKGSTFTLWIDASQHAADRAA